MIKNLVLLVALTTKLVALVLIGMPVAAADDRSEASWREGVSTWNGAGYDLPVQVPVAPGSPWDLGSSDSETPYTVPVGPQANPYYASQPEFPSPTFAELSTDLSTNGIEDQVSVDDPMVDIAESTGKPFSQTAESAGPENVPSKAPDDQPISSTTALPTGPERLENDHGEQPPLQESVVRWYQYPQRWMKGWDSNAEFGIDGSEGNANTLAIQTGVELNRKTDLYTLALDFDYRQASSASTTIENNGRVNVDYDRLLADSQWSAFGKFGVEWDRFKAFDLRLNVNGGAGYHWIREDETTLVTRFGAGASREIGAPVDQWTPEAVFGIDSKRQLNSRNKLTAKLDYFPAWEDFNNYRVVFDAAWEILLDDSDNLSLKLAVTDRYDSTPQGAKPNDVYYALLLLYKF